MLCFNPAERRCGRFPPVWPGPDLTGESICRVGYKKRAGKRSTTLFESELSRSWLLVLALCCALRPAWAADVILHIPDFPESGVEFLQGASLANETAENPGVTAQDLVAAAKADYARLVGALYELGYYGGSVRILVDGREAANLSTIAAPPQVSKIDIHIDAGPAFTFSTARLQPLARTTAVPEGFRTGANAFSSTIRDAARAGVEGWRNQGHAKAAISEQRIRANHQASTLDADIRLNPGPRLRFGDLMVKDTGKVRPDRVKQIAGLPTGEVFSPEELDEASDRLRRTGAFRSVVLSEDEVIGPGDTLDIHAALVGAKPRRVGAGAEISSFEGLTLSGFWLHRNLMGGAERLRFEGEVSGIGGETGGTDYRFSVRFERPATFTPDTALYLEAQVEQLDEPDFRERNAGVGAGFTHIFNDKLSGELGLAYQYSEIDDAAGSRTLEHLLLPARLTFDNRNEQLDATSGSYVDLEFTPFAGLDPKSAGARLFVDARGYKRLTKDDKLVFAGRLQLGSVSGAGLTEVPSDMLFFSGGAGTVRGQPYQSLGVDLGGGNQIGGRFFLGLSAELRAELFGNWGVVGFADTGFVGPDSWGTQNGDSHAGAGLGVRYDTGIGPIRFDVATPLGDDAGRDFEFYIGIGQAF